MTREKNVFEIKDVETELRQALSRIEALEKELYQRTECDGTESPSVANRIKGKVVRAPRSVLRILSEPSILKDIYKRYLGVENKVVVKESEADPPIKYIKSDSIRLSGHPYKKIPTVEVATDGRKRLNLVTDSMSSDSLFGGVATALIVATSFANKYDYELRIVTLLANTDPIDYKNAMIKNKIKPARNVSFYYADQNASSHKMEICAGDIFMATSWWSANAIKKTTDAKFFYIIQEVETFFYNYSCERLLCEKIMAEDKKIAFLVNSHYLFDYFKNNNKNIVKNGVCFEPAFSRKKPNFNKRNSFKKKFFFYARPGHPRNLYAYGIHIIDLALRRGILNSEEWDIYFAGINAEEVEFSDGTRSINLGLLSIEEYLDFLTSVDLGLSLMYTPHPSYPPYDIVSSGGVVLTNKMLNKTHFDESDNIIMSELDDEDFMANMKKAISLATDTNTRKENFQNNKIESDWNKTLKNTVKYMKECVDEWKK